MTKTRGFLLVLAVTLLVIAIPARAQEKDTSRKPNTEGEVRKIIHVKDADPESIVGLLSFFGVRMAPNRRMKVISVAGLAPAVEAVEEAIKKLDVPPPPTRDIDITAYFLLATRQPIEGANLPKDLDEVVNQLKRVLNYQSFRLLNTALIRTRDGDAASVTGVASGGGGESQRANFQFFFHSAHIVPEGKAATIQIEGLNFVMERPGATKDVVASVATSALQATKAQISTHIDVPEGLKVVVGKTAFDSPDNALVLVLTAKVVD